MASNLNWILLVVWVALTVFLLNEFFALNPNTLPIIMFTFFLATFSIPVIFYSTLWLKSIRNTANYYNPNVKHHKNLTRENIIVALPLLTLPSLKKLTLSNNAGVRMKVAYRNNISSELLQILATDLTPSVRQGVAYNPKTPLTVLAALTQDSDYSVKHVASQNYSVASTQQKL